MRADAVLFAVRTGIDHTLPTRAPPVRTADSVALASDALVTR